jgi:hypothetical protein
MVDLVLLQSVHLRSTEMLRVNYVKNHKDIRAVRKEWAIGSQYAPSNVYRYLFVLIIIIIAVLVVRALTSA